jgi:membrane-associated phospholipid phosphatase
MVSVHRPGVRPASDRRAVVARRQRRTALVAAAAFVVVLLGVKTGATQALDRSVADWLRPHDEWGAVQDRLRPVIDALEPRRAYAVLALVTAVVGLRRRLWSPLLFAALVASVSMASTSAVKVWTHRPDLNGDVASTGGSFPSGHVIALLTCLGCCALMWWRHTRWWQWTVIAVPPAVMACALLVTGAHWLTDVVGGALLAIATLAWAASWPLRIGVAARRRRVDAPTEERRTVPVDDG